MGILDQAKAGMKLRAFLTPRNLQYLGALLDTVTDDKSPAFAPVWARFKAYFPTYPKASVEALGKLRELKGILADYLESE